MKRILVLALLAAQATFLHAAVVLFELSPAGTDNAIGLSPSNEVPPVADSTGSGNVTGTGITFDTTSLTFNLSLGYGSAAGFSNLTGPATDVTIEGPAPTNTTAPVIVDLSSLNVPSTNAANGGFVSGSIVLTTNENWDLLAGLDYINISTAANTNGEIRGQLVPVDTLPTVVCPQSTTAQCQGPDGTPVTLTTVVSSVDGNALTVVWTANGIAVQTNLVALGASTNATSISLNGLYQFGTNTVVVSVSDGIAPPVTCTVQVAIIDTIPPVITSASVTPDILWPPDHKFVPVQVSISATDTCSTNVITKIASITSSEDVNAKGSGHTSPDFEISGDLTALLRAERSGKDKEGRIYTITVEAIDEAGNISETNLLVTVPHDEGHNKGGSPGNGNGKSNGNGDGNGNGNGNGNGHGKNK